MNNVDYLVNWFCVHLSWLYISQSYNSAVKYTDAHETTQSRYSYNIINVYKNTIGIKRNIRNIYTSPLESNKTCNGKHAETYKKYIIP